MSPLDSENTPLSSLPPPRRRYVEGDYSAFGEYENDELERILMDPAVSPADRVSLANEMLTRRLDIGSATDVLYSILRGFEGNQTRYRAAIALARQGEWNAEVWRALRHIADRYPMSHGDARMAFDILAARGGPTQGTQRTFSAPLGAVVGGQRPAPPRPGPLVVQAEQDYSMDPEPEAAVARGPVSTANQPEQWEKLPTFSGERLSVRSAASKELLNRVPDLRHDDEEEEQPRRQRRGRRSSRNKPLSKMASHPLVSFGLITLTVLAVLLLLATCMPVQNAEQLERIGAIEEPASLVN